jgi:nucleoid DNA-binding protein
MDARRVGLKVRWTAAEIAEVKESAAAVKENLSNFIRTATLSRCRSKNCNHPETPTKSNQYKGDQNMTKAVLAKTVSEKAELTLKDTAKVVDLVFDTIKASLAAGDKVSIAGFGNFDVQAKPARQGRNPSTGATMEIPARRAVGFKAGLALKTLVNPE